MRLEGALFVTQRLASQGQHASLRIADRACAGRDNVGSRLGGNRGDSCRRFPDSRGRCVSLRGLRDTRGRVRALQKAPVAVTARRSPGCTGRRSRGSDGIAVSRRTGCARRRRGRTLSRSLSRTRGRARSRARSRTRARSRSRSRCGLGCGNRRRRCGRGLWRRSRGWRGNWRGRRRGCRWRAGGSPRRKERERIDVRVTVADANPEVDVGHVVLRVSGWSGLGDGVSLLHARTAPDPERPEVGERCLVTVARGDRDGQAVSRDLPCERHLPCHRRPHCARVANGDVDTTVLPSGVLVLPEGKLPQDGPVDRPGPCPRARGDDECTDHRAENRHRPPRCPSSEHRSKVARGRAGRNAVDELVTESRGRARSSRSR